MSVTNQVPYNISTAAPGATLFPYDFKILAQYELLVKVDGVAKTAGVDFTVDGIAEDAGGNITFTVPMTGGEIVTRQRFMLFQRLTDFQNLGDLRSSTLNNDQDSPILMLQQLAAFALQGTIDSNGEFVWDAQQNRIINVADGTGEQDAVNLRQMLLEIETALAGGPTYGVTPKYWPILGDGVQTDFSIAGADVADPVFYDVMLDRLGQDPADDYEILIGDDLEESVIRFATPPANLEEGWVVLRGYARAFSLGDPITLSMLLDYLRVRIVTEADAAFDLNAADHARALVITTNAGAVTATLDENSAAGFEAGDFFSIKQGGAGAVTVDTSAVTITVPAGYEARPRGQNCIITFTCEDRDTNAWAVSGDLDVVGGSSAPVVSVNGLGGVVELDAADVPIADAAGYFTGTDVEAALAELAAVSAHKIAVLSAAFPSSVLARADVTGWTFPVVAGKSYRIEVTATYQTAATTTGGSMGFAATGGAAGTFAGYQRGAITAAAASTALEAPVSAIGSVLTTTGVSAINTPHAWMMSVIFTCTADGTLAVQWGSEVNASAAQLNIGSALVVTRLN